MPGIAVFRPVIVQRYMARQMLAPIIASVAVLCGPVILIALLNHLPGTALRTSLAWIAIQGIVPTALSLSLPLAVGLGITWSLAYLRADNGLHAMFAMRVSVLALCRPLLLVALPLVAVGYLLSCVIAPRSVTQIQDVMILIRNNLSVVLFHPQTFYTLGDGRYTLFFDRKEGEEEIGGVIFQETQKDGDTNLIVARAARFESRNNEQHIVFAEGTLQSLGADGLAVRTTQFQEMARPFGQDGTAAAPKRAWRGLFELDTPEFLAVRAANLASPRLRTAWMSEAVKRFGVPLLALAHPLAGLVIVLGWRAGAGLRVLSPHLFCVPIVLLHLVILFGAESVTYFNAWMAWLVVAAILLELVLPLALLVRMQRRAV